VIAPDWVTGPAAATVKVSALVVRMSRAPLESLTETVPPGLIAPKAPSALSKVSSVIGLPLPITERLPAVSGADWITGPAAVIVALVADRPPRSSTALLVR